MRNDRSTVVGKVTSSKANKTITVEVERRVKHPRFRKYVRRYSKCYTHDEENDANPGDTVEIMETRPMSKQKRWRLIKVLQRSEG